MNKKLFGLALLLLLIAAIPRFYDLGKLGFYMDEETTAFASRSIAEQGAPQMPSGMPYMRSLPHSWANAQFADIFGADNEISYRLVSALLGTLTIPLLFLCARPYVGTGVAFVAALLLALSDLHIITSRQARMYAPFLFFYLATVFSILGWARKGDIGLLLLSAVLFLFTASLHNFGVLLAFIPLIILFVRGYSRINSISLTVFSMLGGIAAFVYGRLVVKAPYKEWKQTNGIESMSDGAGGIGAIIESLDLMFLVPVAVGAVLGIFLAYRLTIKDDDVGGWFRLLSLYLLSLSLAIFAVSGHLYGSLLVGALLVLLHQEHLFTWLKQAAIPLIAIAIASLPAIYFSISEAGLIEGLKSQLVYPYPNWRTLIDISPGAMLLFLFAMFAVFLMQKVTDNHLRFFIICATFPVVIVSFFMEWAPARYLLVAFPFVLLVAAKALEIMLATIFTTTSSSAVLSWLLPVIVVLSGMLGGQGLLYAYQVSTIDYGDEYSETALIFPVYPDHKNAGLFVLEHKKPGDIVVAEDALQQAWYVGDVDFWLRKPSNHKSFLFADGKGLLRDIYVNSIAVTPEILVQLRAETTQRIWIITSGESFHRRNHYLSQQQMDWLNELEQEGRLQFTGKDGITFVYCMNC